jgi:hypothetical protein
LMEAVSPSETSSTSTRLHCAMSQKSAISISGSSQLIANGTGI